MQYVHPEHDGEASPTLFIQINDQYDNNSFIFLEALHSLKSMIQFITAMKVMFVFSLPYCPHQFAYFDSVSVS